MDKVVDHIIIGGEAVSFLAKTFPYIHGIISVHTGKTDDDGTPILDIAFDTLEVSREKIYTTSFASALVHNASKVVIYGEDVSHILTNDIPEDVRSRVLMEPMHEFSLDTEIEPLPFPIVGILAAPNEASPFQQTSEGAQKALRDTKRALLNLLEDAREAEDTVRKQAEDLTQALEKTSALADARANFISTASHQLRTPLTTMRWFSEMLTSGDAGELPTEAKDYLSQISQGIDRMTNLVSFLLRSARIESKRVTIKPEPVRIRSAIDRAIEKLNENLSQKKQEVVVQGDDDPVIPLDAEFLNEVLVNLISNANLYSPEATTITISIAGKDDIVIVSIHDTGIGIKEADRPRVFDKFFRAPEAVIASPDGSGLGLAYVREIVHQWDGDITFTSVEGKETTFRFTIPKRGMSAREGEERLSE